MIWRMLHRSCGKKMGRRLGSKMGSRLGQRGGGRGGGRSGNGNVDAQATGDDDQLVFDELGADQSLDWPRRANTDHGALLPPPLIVLRFPHVMPCSWMFPFLLQLVTVTARRLLLSQGSQSDFFVLRIFAPVDFCFCVQRMTPHGLGSCESAF